MAITRGADAALVTKFESTFGTFATGDFDLRPFLTWTAGAEEEVVRPSIIDGVRDPEAPIAGVYNLTGDAEVPLDVRNIGFWFKATFGDPVTTGTGPYTHTFKSGAESIPTFSAELGVSSATTFLQMTGLCVNSMRLGWQPSSGSPSATFGLLGKDETKEATSGGGTPAEAALTRFSRFHGAITRNASPLGEVLEAELTYGNNLEGLFFVGQGRSVSAIKLGGADFGGSITVRYESATLFDDAVAGTPVNLGLSYSIDASNKLTFSLPNVTLPKPRLEVRGPGGIDVTYQLFPSRQSDGSEAMTVTLVNDVESY